MKVYILRIGDQRGRWWAISDGKRTVTGKIGQRKQDVISRWSEKHGKPTGTVRFRGICRPSEAAMTLASIARQKDEEE